MGLKDLLGKNKTPPAVLAAAGAALTPLTGTAAGADAGTLEDLGGLDDGTDAGGSGAAAGATAGRGGLVVQNGTVANKSVADLDGLLEAFPDDPKFASSCFKAGMSVEQAKARAYDQDRAARADKDGLERRLGGAGRAGTPGVATKPKDGKGAATAADFGLPQDTHEYVVKVHEVMATRKLDKVKATKAVNDEFPELRQAYVGRPR